ncbi:MAG: ribonuclease III [Kangiellaceae bacterium]|nr:ribonuclease III [Kangiellaceae bacterium]|tara:strand:+ start:1364 stop:2050 length:687 start_codon:yes stop_codon:yes gene_type:complete
MVVNTELEKSVGYLFKNKDLFERALKHRSCGKNNNERLEFLGDSILGFVVADALYQRFPKEKEGILTRFRSYVVKGETLYQVALKLNLTDYVVVGPGELKSGGYRRESTLADCVEAIIGAIYLDGGLEPAKAFIFKYFNGFIEQLDKESFGKDAKTRLQELLQKHQVDLPDYAVKSIDGKDHHQIFNVTCSVSHFSIVTTGRGTSRRKAEQQAAERALQGIHDRQSKN